MKDQSMYLPRLEELTKLYRVAVERKDATTLQIAEAAVMKLAAAEAAVVEATVLAKFLEFDP